MDIKNWLTRGGIKGIDFGADLELLKAIALLDKELDADAADTDLEDVLQALDTLAFGGPGITRVQDILKEGKLDGTAVAAAWKKLRNEALRRIPDAYEALGYRLVDLTSGDTALPKTLIDWSLVDEGKTISPKDQADLQVDVADTARLGVSFEALPKSLPHAYPATAVKPEVRIGINGNLSAGVEAKVPVNWGSVAGDAGAGAETKLNWYFHNARRITFATALIRDIRRLCSPFDLKGIDELSRRHSDGRAVSPRLAGIQMLVGGRLGFGGEIELTDAVGLVTGAAGGISAKVGFRAQRRGEYRYFVYRDGGLVISLHRDRYQGTEVSGSLGVDPDLTPLLGRLKGLLQPSLGRLSDLLDRLQEILPSSAETRESLVQGIGKALDRSSQAQTLKALIGFDPERQPNAVLADRILTEVETSAARWADDAKAAAAKVAGDLMNRMRIPAPQADELRKLIQKQAAGLITKEVKRLTGRLEELVDSKADFADLVEILGKLGDAVDTGVEKGKRIAEVLEPVRRHLNGYQFLVQKLRGTLKTAVEAKLQARISVEEARQVGTVVDLLIRFRQLNGDAETLYRKVMTGSLEEAFRLLREQPDDGPIELIGGELASYTNLDCNSGYGINLLGYAVAGSRALDADLEFVTDGNGDIRVTSKTAIEQCRNDWREGRCLSFVNVYSLASASRTNQLQLSLTLNQNDTRVEPEDIRGFFQNLEQSGLLRQGTTRSAMGFYVSLLDVHPLSDLTGQLETGFRLDAGQILQLLGIDGDGNLVRPDAAVLNLAIDELVPITGEAVKFRERFIDDAAKKRIKEYFPRLDASLSGDLKQAIAELDENRASRMRARIHLVIAGDDPFEQMQLARDIDNVKRYRQHAQHIQEMVVLLRRVYLSGKTPGSWSEADYAKAQENLDDYLRFWINVDSEWMFLIPDRIRPFTIAFIRILAQLAGLPVGDGEHNLVSAKLTVDGRAMDLTKTA